MIALWILLGCLAAVGLIGCLPVAVTAVYDAAGPQVWAKIGPWRISLYPRPETAKETMKPEKAKTEKQTKDAEGAEKRKGGKLKLFREVTELVLEAQADVRNKLLLREITLYLTVGGKGNDPAKAAVLYGNAWAAIGVLWPQMERAFRIRRRDIRADVDFLTEDTTVYAKATAVISVGSIVRMAGYYGIRGFRIFHRHKKKGSVANGTSNQ